MGMAAGFVTLTVNKTGAFTLRLVQGKKSFSHSGKMGPLGSALIKVPSVLYPFVRGEDSNGADYCSLWIDGGIRFSFGNEAPAAPDQRSSGLSKAAGPDVVKSLPSRRINASLGDGPAGYAGFDVTAGGIVLSTGMVNLEERDINGETFPRKTLKYTSSTPLVLVAGSDPTSDEFVPGVSFYAVGVPNALCVNGFAALDGSSLSGSLGTATVRTGALDPAQATDDPVNYGNDGYYNTVSVAGSAYIAPKAGQRPPPFSESQSAFTVMASVPFGDAAYTMGDLQLARGKPAFLYRAVNVAEGEAPFVTKATMDLLPATGAFSGRLTTQVNGVAKTRAYTGVVVQAAEDTGFGPVAVGISVDGLLISFESKD